MIVTQLAAPNWRPMRAYVATLTFFAIFGLISAPIAAQSGNRPADSRSSGNNGNNDDNGKGGPGRDDRDRGGKPGPPGPQGPPGPAGPAGPGSNATSAGYAGHQLIGLTCTNYASQTIAVAPGTPGIIVATAKIIVRINHAGVPDRGFITFGTSPTDCNSDPYRSYFRVPGIAGPANNYNPTTNPNGEFYEFSIPVEVPFPAGPGPFYLNGQMLTGVPTVGGVVTPNDYMSDATITLEFHTTP